MRMHQTDSDNPAMPDLHTRGASSDSKDRRFCYECAYQALSAYFDFGCSYFLLKIYQQVEYKERCACTVFIYVLWDVSHTPAIQSIDWIGTTQLAERMEPISTSVVHLCFLLDLTIIPMKRTMHHANAIRARNDTPAYTANMPMRKKIMSASSKLIFMIEYITSKYRSCNNRHI